MICVRNMANWFETGKFAANVVCQNEREWTMKNLVYWLLGGAVSWLAICMTDDFFPLSFSAIVFALPLWLIADFGHSRSRCCRFVCPSVSLSARIARSSKASVLCRM